MSTQPALTEFGITGLKKSSPMKDALSLASELRGLARRSAWGCTDLAVWWADHSSKPMQLLADALCIRVETLYDWTVVGRKFPLADRDTESDYLTYSHYRALCAIEDREKRLRWRDRAATERIPVHELRGMLKGTKDLSDAGDVPKPTKTRQSRQTSSQNETRGFKASDGGPLFSTPETPLPIVTSHSGHVQGKPPIVLPRDLSDRLYQLGGNYEGALAEAVRRIEQSFAMPQPNRRGEYLEVRS